jgi:16S rRNA (guanine966-N2)-methyltransferase
VAGCARHHPLGWSTRTVRHDGAVTRIVAGAAGGRRLAVPPKGTRPTADRVREALFSMLGPLDGVAVLDPFAGSGALAIEALSRGAASALLVDRDPRAVAVARGNLEALGLRPPEAVVVRGTAVAALRTARERGDKYGLVLLDPPYRHAAAVVSELGELLPDVLAAGARVVVESDRRAVPELALPLDRERRYGDTIVRIHTT